MFFTCHLKSTLTLHTCWASLQPFPRQVSLWDESWEPVQWASPPERSSPLRVQKPKDTQPTHNPQCLTQRAPVTTHQPPTLPRWCCFCPKSLRNEASLCLQIRGAQVFHSKAKNQRNTKEHSQTQAGLQEILLCKTCAVNTLFPILCEKRKDLNRMKGVCFTNHTH